MLRPIFEAAHGARFAAYIFSSFGRPVSLPSLGPGSFSLLVAFGRCRSRLEESFVTQSLSTILGGTADSFHVSQVEDRIFLFTVSCKQVGFAIYKLRSFKCEEFELFFQLFNDSGIAFARVNIDCSPVFPWKEVGKAVSYADAVQNPLLSGANKVPVGSRSVSKRWPSGNPPLSGANTVTIGTKSHSTRQLGASFPRSSVFKRIQFPQQLDPRKSFRSTWIQKPGPSSVHPSLQQNFSDKSTPDLNLNLNLGMADSNPGFTTVLAPSLSLSSSASVRCRRCHSSSHSSSACTAPIKCDKCLEWGHIVATCNSSWRVLQVV